MSVLIKGMEMPESCDKCELMTANYGCAFVGAVGGESYRKRAWDCPLVEVPEPMKWIPVTERLPEDGAEVLAWSQSGFAYVDWWIDGAWKVNSLVDGKYEFVTHWMPLPQPPESEGE